MNTLTQFSSENDVFTIDCQDIILREYLIGDLDAFHALTWQPEIYEYLPDWNAPRAQREDWFINYELEENKQFLNAVSEGRDIGALRLRLGIISKETGEFIGWCCTGIKDELPWPNREIMYALSSKHRNKGYTTQAVEGLLTYLFQNTTIDALSTLALVRNLPSNRVIQKCGFYYQNTIELEHESYHYYRLLKREWEIKQVNN